MAELLEARDELAQDKQGRANLWYQVRLFCSILRLTD